MINLYKALLSLKTESECERFLKDLCTPQELNDFESRWAIAQLIDKGDQSYREIAEKTQASITTVTRVARFLNIEPYQGYKLILNRLKAKINKNKK
jgi:TrpR-related protein YerC/YecD